MNYEEMWKELKDWVIDSINWYKDSPLCSLRESIHGERTCNEFLKKIEEIEKNFKEEV